MKKLVFFISFLVAASSYTVISQQITGGGGGSSTPPGGSNTQVQYNNSGAFGGSANLTWVSPALTVGVQGTTTGQLVLATSATSSGAMTLKAGTLNSGAAWTFTYPSGPGTIGQALETDGSGNATWSGGSGNPTASIGLTAVNGAAATWLRSDSAPALSQAIAPTWTGAHTWQAVSTFAPASAGLGTAVTITGATETSSNPLFAGTQTNNATSGTILIGSLSPTFSPSATSTMVAQTFKIAPTINYSNGTPGAGSYEALKIVATETALPTGTNYLIRASAGSAGTTDKFLVTNTGIVESTFNNPIVFEIAPTGQNPVGIGRNSSVGGLNLHGGGASSPDNNPTLLIQGARGANPIVIADGSTFIGWSVSSVTQTMDTAFARNAIGVVEIDSGTAGAYRDLKLRSLIMGGSVPSISGCSAGTQVGGNTSGTYVSGTTGACTVVLTFAFTAPNGWFCAASDRTTPANLIAQSASTTTTCTLTGTTVTSDVVGWGANAY